MYVKIERVHDKNLNVLFIYLFNWLIQWCFVVLVCHFLHLY